MDQDKIGNFIKTIRQENNLTQKDLADRLGVTYQAVSKWENGKNIPDLSIIKKLCDEFNMDIDELLNGVKKEKEKKHNKIVRNTIIALLIVVVLFAIYIVNNINNSRNFEFKTISSQCRDFNITGSAAYNKEKTSIYISNIEFCGKEDSTIYKEITCVLYETYNDTKTKISSCKKEKNKKLEDFLKEVNISVDHYSSSCKNLTSNILSLEIQALNEENKTITYNIPIKLNDTCK